MTLPSTVRVPGLSGERFRVRYRLTGGREEVEAKAAAVCVEQTVEFPDDLVPAGDIRERIVGRVEDLERVGHHRWAATISYAVETTGNELTQLLNVIFGNSSIKPGIRVERLELSEAVLSAYAGPRFGRAGLRELLDAHGRPLLATALKPMGLPAEALADLAHRFALGGVDIVKDDHGLADQPFCRYEERVQRCAEAVATANRQTGRRCLYVPHVTAPADALVDRVRFAKRAGAGGLLICPCLTGFDSMRVLAGDDAVALPILSHPAFQGMFVTTPDEGVSHFVLYGQMMRLAGADAAIYPNFGGRFSLTRSECRSIVSGTAVDMGHVKPIFPTPAGGMTEGRIPEMREVYGDDAIYLIGGGLHRGGPDLVENTRRFIDLLSRPV